MKAYKVYYTAPGKHDSTILLVETAADIEVALSKKDKSFDIGDRWSSIESKHEVPLSSVLIKDLTIVEFMKLMGKEI